MRLKVCLLLGVALAGLSVAAPPARAAHCGACSYPISCQSPDQLCPPPVRYRVCYQTITEELEPAVWTPLEQEFNSATTVVIRTRLRE